MNNELKLINKETLPRELIVDTLEIARNKFPGSSISLDALCKRFRVDNSRREKHTALIDCELLSKVYINLLDQKEPVFKFQIDEKKNKKVARGKTNYSKKIIEISQKELQDHKEFLNRNLKKNFFN